MASPFPGMDPYLEQFWGDVHASLIIYARDQLRRALPGDLRARVEERVVVDSPVERERSRYPDIRVVERGRGKRTAPLRKGAVATAEPLVLHFPDESITEGYIEIIDVGSGRKVVTVIEVLSPSNKQPGPGQKQYLEKQQELLAGRVSLVEIDLLRAGQRVTSVPPQSIPPSHRTPYQAVARRGWDLLAAEVYAVPLRERLPVIKVPLRDTDADVPLDLQALIDQCYHNSGYDDDIDYTADPVPPLAPEDARWADALLRRAQRRSRSAVKRPRRKPGRKTQG